MFARRLNEENNKKTRLLEAEMRFFPTLTPRLHNQLETEW